MKVRSAGERLLHRGEQMLKRAQSMPTEFKFKSTIKPVKLPKGMRPHKPPNLRKGGW